MWLEWLAKLSSGVDPPPVFHHVHICHCNYEIGGAIRNVHLTGALVINVAVAPNVSHRG